MTTDKRIADSARRPLILSLNALLMMVSVLASPISNAQWHIDPLLKIGLDYDDNAELATRSDQEVELSGYLLDAGANFAYTAERTTFNVLPRVLIRNYPDESEFDRTDVFLTSRFNHNMKSSALSYRLFYDQQAVRTAERADNDLRIEDVDDIFGDDSGRVGVRGDRYKWRFLPRWTYRFSEASSLIADFDYTDVRYEDVFLNLLDDYKDARLNLSYARQVSSRNTMVVLATGRRYENEDVQVDPITGYGFQVGVNRSLSQTSDLRAMIGMEDTNGAIGSSDPEVVGNLTLTRRLETIRMFVQVRRSVNATGAGRLSLRDQISINFNRNLNERISAGIGVRAYQSRGLGSDFVDVDDRDYIQLRTQFVWHLNTTFSVEADYRYTVLDRGTVQGDRANSNHVNLWFVYQPNSLDR